MAAILSGACEVSCTLVEPPSEGDKNDEGSGTDRKAAAGGGGGAAVKDRSTSLEEMADDELQCRRQREAFVKTRVRIERNLHVVRPSVTAVSQLGQEMLGGVEIIDFDSPRSPSWTTIRPKNKFVVSGNMARRIGSVGRFFSLTTVLNYAS